MGRGKMGGEIEGEGMRIEMGGGGREGRKERRKREEVW